MGSDSSQGWDKLGEVVNVESMITFAMGGIATQIIQHHTPPCDTDLEWCKKELEGIKTRINELSPDRRERMRIAARQGKCVSLETLESRLLSLLDERCGLAARAAGSNFFQRYLPAALSQLRTDIGVLKDAVSQLWEDTSNTTTIHMKKDKNKNRSVARVDANTRARAHFEAHPLNLMAPPRAHVRDSVSQVPMGIA